jgi:hypothetical protein
MSRRTILITSSLIFAASTIAFAQTVQTDPQAYCAYLTEQAKAQSDLLRTPKGNAVFTQPETGLPTQLVAGATLSLSDYKKSGLTLDAARKNCDLYQATVDVQQVLQYALPNIERDALRNRLDLIAQASTSLGAMIDKTAKMVEAQNMTRPMLLEMQMNRIKLESDRADTQSRISAIYVPALNAQSLKKQVAQKQANDIVEQKALATVTRQSNWDVQLAVGAHKQINPLANGIGPYGEVTASYSFASRAIDKHLDRAVDDYASWKKVQLGDTASSMEVLRTQVADNIVAQQARLKSLQDEAQQVEKNLQTIGEADTTAALDFRNQLASTRLLLNIEIGDANFRIEHLLEFLTANY